MARKMTIEEKRRVIEFEKRERYSLTCIVDELKNKNPELDYNLYLSPIDSDCPYDGLLTIRNNKQEILNTFLIEMKNRSCLYSKMFMEKKKLNGLKKSQLSIKMELNRTADILYINTTDKYTMIFPINEMELGKSTRETMSSESFSNVNVKRNKLVYSLKLKDAIKIKFRFLEEEYKKSIEPIKVVIENKPKTYSIF